MRPDDGYQNGYVTLTIVENGNEHVFEDVYIAFSKDRGKWKVAKLSEHVSEHSWEEAYRGYVGDK